MPIIRNYLQIRGTAAEIAAVLRFIQNEAAGIGSVDFNAIEPMPSWIYSGELSPEAEDRYGAENCWKRWCISHWGCQRNAVFPERSAEEYDGGDTILFFTEDCDVRELMRKLSLVFKNLRFDYMIHRALKVHPGREQDYCKKMDSRFLDELNRKKAKTLEDVSRIWYNGETYRSSSHYDNSRYAALNLHSVFQKGTIEFRLFNSDCLKHAGKAKAYLQFCLALSHKALTQRSASPRKTVSPNEKYTFRVFLLNLGLIGDEFKTARQHLLGNLEGNIAWRDPAQAERQKERLQQQREQARQLAAASEPEPEYTALESTETEEMEMAEDEQDLGLSMSM